jgi:hypothetical protein
MVTSSLLGARKIKASRDAGPVKINHRLKILRGEAIMQTS